MSGPNPRHPDDERPSWMGAPGYQPHRELPPHAPMPGAPPYPPYIEHPPPPVGAPARRTRFRAVLGVTAIAAVLNLVLVLVVNGPAPSAEALGRVTGQLAFPALLGAFLLWLGVRRRKPAFWVLALLGLGTYAVLRLLIVLPTLSAR